MTAIVLNAAKSISLAPVISFLRQLAQSALALVATFNRYMDVAYKVPRRDL